MFIRRTKTRTTDSGAQYYSYRLVDTCRVAGRVRQRTLLNLGSGFTFPRRQWPELSQRIEQIIVGQHQLLPFPPGGGTRGAEYCGPAGQQIRRVGAVAGPEKGGRRNSENA